MKLHKVQLNSDLMCLNWPLSSLQFFELIDMFIVSLLHHLDQLTLMDSHLNFLIDSWPSLNLLFFCLWRLVQSPFNHKTSWFIVLLSLDGLVCEWLQATWIDSCHLNFNWRIPIQLSNTQGIFTLTLNLLCKLVCWKFRWTNELNWTWISTWIWNFETF